MYNLFVWLHCNHFLQHMITRSLSSTLIFVWLTLVYTNQFNLFEHLILIVQKYVCRWSSSNLFCRWSSSHMSVYVLNLHHSGWTWCSHRSHKSWIILTCPHDAIFITRVTTRQLQGGPSYPALLPWRRRPGHQAIDRSWGFLKWGAVIIPEFYRIFNVTYVMGDNHG